MLAVSPGFVFATHYCGGKAVRHAVAVSAEPLDCGMSGMDFPCEHGGNSSSFHRKSCCDTQYQKVNIRDSFEKGDVRQMSDTGSLWTFCSFPVRVFSRVEPARNHADYLNYLPPLLDADILVSIQAFRI